MFGDFQRRREGDVNLTRDSDSRDLAQPHFISLAYHVIEISTIHWLTMFNCMQFSGSNFAKDERPR